MDGHKPRDSGRKASRSFGGSCGEKGGHESMTGVGVLLALVGIIGFVLTFMGILPLTGVFANPTIYAGAAVAGIVLFFLFRRPSD